MFNSHMTTLDRARYLEMTNTNPQDEVLGKLLVSLGNQSAERIQSVANRMDIDILKFLTQTLSSYLEVASQEKAGEVLVKLKSEGYSDQELRDFFRSLIAVTPDD
ncbi:MULTISPECIES: hypothetical protein [Vibrio]|uniref:hypothetical protein n=1 Tax=Vibrio TaxID=662 RepID=UPI001268779E|nr:MULTISPECIES: hypothetical protein [Vibrio]MCG9660918.1 hypothetical protein [Vibrio mediterranei]